MNRVSTTVTPTLLFEMAGSSRATAAGMFAVSNQVSVFTGASIGGAMLALGGFPAVGYFCAAVAVAAAVVVTLKVRNPEEFLVPVTTRDSSPA